MISTLQAFLIQAAKEQTEVEVKVSKRIGQPFKIKAIDLDEWERIQKLSTEPDGAQRVNSMAILKRTVIAGCIEPEFKSAEFIKELGCNKPDEALVKCLKAGEIVTLGNKILKFSGFGESVEEARKQALD